MLHIRERSEPKKIRKEGHKTFDSDRLNFKNHVIFISRNSPVTYGVSGEAKNKYMLGNQILEKENNIHRNNAKHIICLPNMVRRTILELDNRLIH